jgi:tRNA uridine 5-carboxymethylaminomethyl modification enzyme
MKSIFAREMNKLQSQNCDKGFFREPTRFVKLLKRPELEYSNLDKYGYKIEQDVSEAIMNRITLEVKYEGYLKRQLADIDRFEKAEHSKIPTDIDYMKIDSIAYEAREKLNKIKPTSLGQALRVSGVNHTDVNSLLVFLKKNNLLKNGKTE